MSIRNHKKVAVTATTGMASTQLGFNATTLHHWSGILDGRYSLPRLKELFDHDDRFAAARSRIENTDCLTIDEISMLSKKTMELVDSVCKHVRKSQHMFGGIQVIYHYEYIIKTDILMNGRQLIYMYFHIIQLILIRNQPPA